MAKKDEGPRGIQWSAPVLVRKAPEGLSVVLPERVIAALRLGAGDVLNFTELPGGSIEVWMVPKSTYANLDAMAGDAAKPAATKAKNPAKKKRAKQKAAKRTARGAKR